ncbi:MAG: homoserine kinase [Armatimonadota bacterium]|nr:homoserine kinase [Armatimonadota bacterium]MCX7776836.1 homoserine kinase [Armatimonadota bacterium]MDW8024478.1 homoserine kinase [Armatimonadota bacterium]
MMGIAGARVKVPATIANIGSGFDALGLAISWHNIVEIERSHKLRIEIHGEGEGELPRDESNICYKAFVSACELLGEKPPCVTLRLRNFIPLERGLGSSAAARVGGILAATALLQMELKSEDVLTLAAKLEGHTDNVAPALLGGLVISGWKSDGTGVFAVRLPIEYVPPAVVLIPNCVVPTELARSILPKTVPLNDAVFNLGRACLLLGSLVAGKIEFLREALMDRLHQPYRQKLMPWLSEVISAALEAGAIAACLSGAGSAIAAFVKDNAEAVSDAMLTALQRHGINGYTKLVHMDKQGAQVERW